MPCHSMSHWTYRQGGEEACSHQSATAASTRFVTLPPGTVGLQCSLGSMALEGRRAFRAWPANRASARQSLERNLAVAATVSRLTSPLIVRLAEASPRSQA